MRFCIHRGTHEIGGTCVEIESQGKRIVLDIGLPLDAADSDAMPLHPVPGFDKPDPSLLGVLISHPHQDHYGLAYRLPDETTFLIGKAARSILEAADLFTPAGLKLKHVIHLEHRKPIQLGPFTITPYLVDHSAYDSYACLVEADGKRLFYSGDFRAHGRKAKLMDELLADPPKDVDVLLMEGTTLGRPETVGGWPVMQVMSRWPAAMPVPHRAGSRPSRKYELAWCDRRWDNQRPSCMWPSRTCELFLEAGRMLGAAPH